MSGTRLLLIVLAVVLGPCTLTATATASADTAALAFTDANGTSDPAARTSRTVTITGNTAAPEHLYVKYRAAGGAACAPSSADDPGDVPFGHPYTGDSFAVAVDGDFTLKRTGSWPSSGVVLFCIWLAGSPSQSVTPISQTVTFRAPSGTIAADVSPAQVVLGQAITVTISGSSEAAAVVDATLHTGAFFFPCAGSYSDDGGRTLVGNHGVKGAFSFVATTTDLYANDSTVCVWLTDPFGPSTPFAGPQQATFSVLAPSPTPVLAQPPACIVPEIPAGTTRIGVLKALTAGHCTLGKETLTPSRSQPRGTLIRLRTAANALVTPPGVVDAVFSAGAPCRVPALKPRTRLAKAKARLRAAGCTVGRVRAVRSSRRRAGIVMAYGPRSGTRLAPSAKVAIVVSRGPGPRRR